MNQLRFETVYLPGYVNPPDVPLAPPTYPGRPINGGRIDRAMPKHGEWFAEPKYNGWRALVHAPTGTMWNRHGQRLSIEREFSTALDGLRCTLDAQAFQWVDCEALERRHNIGRGSLIVLDVVPEPAYRSATYLERRAWLDAVLFTPLPTRRIEDNEIYLAPSSPQAGAMWDFARETNVTLGCEFYEGVVMKRTDSIYPVQLRSADEKCPGWMKHRWKF